MRFLGDVANKFFSIGPNLTLCQPLFGVFWYIFFGFFHISPDTCIALDLEYKMYFLCLFYRVYFVLCQLLPGGFWGRHLEEAACGGAAGKDVC